ncbi:MAG: exodeoxyribonuclease V subunit gamma [Verrucomicrobia bacterium]|nr:exodeoxyribonuclease V subunit gamma [Verrucomicrobiota bacterium]
MKIFASNHLEVLAQALKEELFQGRPLDKRWVIVPNERVKQDLFLRFAHDPLFQVATGFKMITWCEALCRLFPEIPAQAELSLRIEAALNDSQEDELRAYLQHGGHLRKAALCDKMSSLFLQYLTQPEEKLSAWLEKSGWQQTLWRAVFGSSMPWKNTFFFEGSVYLFHPSQCSPYQLEAFKKMNVTCFLFSPCAMYWGDFQTFREQGFLLKRTQPRARKELSQYFQTQHPLLANWGRKGRELLSYFEDDQWLDVYEEPQKSSLLTALQTEMLTLSIMDKSPDDSMQIHSAPSKLREVEAVWEIIQRLPFEPHEILVLAPSMHPYAAAVELVFRQRGGPYDFAIFCLEARSKSPLMQGLEYLLDLPRFRFSKESIEKLLFCPPFLKKFNFEIEEVHRLEKWIKEVHVRYDLKGDHAGTWEAGLQRMVAALVAATREGHLSIEFSQADLLSRWIEVVQLFQQELKVIIEEGKLTLKEWAKTLRDLTGKFFAVDPDDELVHEFEKLQHMQAEGLFPFSSIERILKSLFQQKTGAVQGSHLQAVRFASLEKGALIPAKAIILMGMEEGNFPRQDSPSSLQQIPLPSRSEEDKYLFLEALCSAREKFIMTYVRLHPEDGKSQKACPLVEELSHYAHLKAHDHPFSPFDPAYFQGEGFPSYSQQHFETALQKKRSASVKGIPILPAMPLSSFDIRMLRKLARHPLQYFFENRLGIDFEWKESDGEFVLSPLEMARLRKASLKRPLNELLHEMQQEGKLPVGTFTKVAIQKVKNEIETYHEMLAQLNVRPEEIYSIELKTSCTQPTQIDSQTWIYPTLHIQDVVIQGRIDELCPQGLLVHGDESLADQLKAWPLYLIASHLNLSPSLLLTKKGKISELKIADSKTALQQYIDYAKKALCIPSPLHPKWARGIFKEGKIPPMTEEDDILQWAESRNLLPPSDIWVETWNPTLQEVFHELL